MTNILNNYKIFVFISIFLIFFSCKTRKDVLYLQDIKDKEVLNIPGPSPEYRIKIEDNLYVNIQTVNTAINQIFNSTQNLAGSGWNSSATANQSLTGYIVNSEGNIIIPGLGALSIAGKTASEAQTLIQERANVYLKDASVQVKILSFKITVLGELRNPGVYYNYNNSMTIIDAIGMAGGMTDNAQISQLLIVRRTPTGSKSYRLDLSGKKILSSEAYYLQPNDVIYVNSDGSKTFRLNTTTFSFILSGLTTIFVMLQYFRY